VAQFESALSGKAIKTLRTNPILHLVLGGAAVHRCDKGLCFKSGFSRCGQTGCRGPIIFKGEKLPNPRTSGRDTLAEALYANQKIEEAVKTEQQAIALATAAAKTTFQKSLEKYQLALTGKNENTSK
jgi:hypothetical protein